MLVQTIQSKFGLPIRLSDLYIYKNFCKQLDKIQLLEKMNICIVGKYISYKDAYMSIIKAIEVAGFANTKNIHIDWVESI